MRLRLCVVTLALIAGLVALAPSALAAPEQRLRVGSLELHPCPDGTRWWCGSLPRPLGPARRREASTARGRGGRAGLPLDR